ncbi:GT-D fold domain-containing glycosyltransferase [Paenibacillus puldeungensis]|uniref:GT-D fold domain-containing glycosyltransferase n=1 Tax=Paenibacillus puldeungensis TaxID=696536 RepID=A0ABW3S0L3_9BACL
MKHLSKKNRSTRSSRQAAVMSKAGNLRRYKRKTKGGISGRRSRVGRLRRDGRPIRLRRRFGRGRLTNGSSGGKTLLGGKPSPSMADSSLMETQSEDSLEKAVSPDSDAVTAINLPANRAAETASSEKMTAAAYEDGYREGYFEGGEAKLGRLIPQRMILPEVTVDDVIAAGFQAVSGSLYPLLSAGEVYGEIEQALQSGRPLSVVRLGDGEMLTLAHDTILPTEKVKQWGAFLPHSGVNIPDHSSREALAAAIRSANIVGIPQSRHPSFQGLLFPVLRHFGIDYRGLRLTTSTINYELSEEGYLGKLLKGRCILAIGNNAAELTKMLQQRGFETTSYISPVQGVKDIPRILELAQGKSFDLALVAAGIPAVILCTQIAEKYGKVAIDFGHLANQLIIGKAMLQPVQEV